ncbi:MAG: hypothetical protein F4213_07705 [Boseongicola sp. SB0677_bin_26]|nr:hypothetical protein [Boseongicola sp. SB0665_bin_10]MYG25897.1 hypothetical protein [Boseongicola sp. SB0677_bin_26]
MPSGNEAGAVPHGKESAMIRTGAFAALIALAGPALAVPAFFVEAVPFWISGLPLLAGIWVRTPRARAAAMAGWLAVPAAVSAIGLAGIGHAPEIVWPGAVAAVLALAALAGVTGISLAAFALTAVPFFPASPLVVLADVLPGYGIATLLVVALALASVELLPRHRGQALVTVVAFLVAVNAMEWKPGLQPASRWAEVPEPAAATETGRRLAIRDILPEGGAAILGEAVFREDDRAARDAWCRIVAERDVTLFVGVTETLAGTDRGAVWRLDRETCAPRAVPAIATRAWLGIPGVTGGLLPMPGTDVGVDLVPGEDGRWQRVPAYGRTGTGSPEFLVCLEAFLPWAWARLASEGRARDVVIVSNDGAFGALPVHVLRRKAAGAMATLTKRGVAHAETGRTVLVRAEGALAR